MKEPQRLSAEEAPQLKEEEINKISEKLETIWDRKVITGEVIENVLQITKIMMGFWTVAFSFLLSLFLPKFEILAIMFDKIEEDVWALIVLFVVTFKG